jgi:hypothetical protein
MKGRYIALLPLAAIVVVLTSAATAGTGATKQRAAITAKGTSHISSTGRFVLEPLGTGPLELDSSVGSSVIAGQRSVVRDGQSASIITWVTTCKGKRGSIVFRARIEHVDAGNGYNVGTGTWEVVRGTGTYAGISGGGRVANVTPMGRPWVEREEGILILP